MARITVERSAIGDFLDELPGLIMQYKQMQWAQEERALEREERKAAGAQQILLKEYYDKKAEVGQTEKKAFHHTITNLKNINAPLGGIIMNAVTNKSSYGSFYYYYYHHYYLYLYYN